MVVYSRIEGSYDSGGGGGMVGGGSLRVDDRHRPELAPNETGASTMANTWYHLSPRPSHQLSVYPASLILEMPTSGFCVLFLDKKSDADYARLKSCSYVVGVMMDRGVCRLEMND